MDKKVLVIDRQLWERGTGDGRLRRQSGRMCCLGFDAIACGVDPVDIINVGEPFDVDLPYTRDYRQSRARANADAVREAIRINDDRTMPNDIREELLVPVLKQLGWDDVQFIN